MLGHIHVCDVQNKKVGWDKIIAREVICFCLTKIVAKMRRSTMNE